MLSWLLLHFLIAAVGTLLARRYALQRDLLDHPGERRSHQVATPRGGGVAIVAALLVAIVALATRDPSQRWLLGGFGIGLVLVAAIGMADDHRPLPVSLRLAVHALAAAVLAISVQMASGNPWLAMLAFVSAMVLTNVWNFMDGINGLAASQALLVAMALAWVLGGSWALLAGALAAACAGFLPFNFPRARIFLGDGGSGGIGFSIAGLGTVAAMPDSPAALWLLLPLSAFLVDAGLTLSMRTLQGERWWEAHTRHAYQVWARSKGHTSVTLLYASWTATTVAVMIVLRTTPVSLAVALCVVTYLAASVVWWRLERMESHTKTTGDK
ncbi:lipopolysaccharide biosynthesis protein [Lysobacter ciconiae]|uniref:Lipopolysaccharide biosynthesis protein n=1 Tax=Novilysobacter ciconiae TaxID=2781022 RepID=A0A7S6UHZ2_9GAMM|nr:lipopolysaccharide biosynthesis protein [Lysobacter ciconiae]QOW20637.1 lipopolysaccharide biosynthesis protein [Lysobacter ciconiae]